ncbi:extracellular solute-binding protein [Candidatus Aerophobetes bacterium]|nr:extracellular solute-binding protein [Candidatus Aerophobetes bacterium]
MKKIRCLFMIAVGVILISQVSLSLAGAQPKIKLTVAYAPHPCHKQQVEWIQKWVKTQPNVELELAQLSYEVYFPKVSAAIQSPRCEYDVVWHNDDWGQAWINWMEPVDDVQNFEMIQPYQYENIFTKPEANMLRSTAVPFIGTDAGMFYRKDLIPVPPKTWEEMQVLSIALQGAGKVKWGYVSGMKYPHDYKTFLAFMWANLGDIFWPPFERDRRVLAAYGWTPMVTNVRVMEMVEFWWDQIHKYKTCPPDNIGYSRTTSHAMFMAGDVAMHGADALVYGDLNDPAKSKVAGNVGLAPFPYGPHGKGGMSWDVPWAWAIPKNIPEENKKAAKKALGYILTDEVQIDLWKTTGGLPVTASARDKLMATDPLFQEFAEATFKAPVLVQSALYFPGWPEVHTLFADYVTKALMGTREDIKKNMEKLAEEIKATFE